MNIRSYKKAIRFSSPKREHRWKTGNHSPLRPQGLLRINTGFSKVMSLTAISVHHTAMGNNIYLITDIFESLLCALRVFCGEISCRRPIRLAAQSVSQLGSRITWRLFDEYWLFEPETRVLGHFDSSLDAIPGASEKLTGPLMHWSY